MKNLFFLISIVLLISSCGNDYVLDKKINFQNSQWSYSDTLHCSIDIPDTSKIYNLYLDFEHTTDYSFQNIYIQIHTQFPNGKRLTEVVPIDLMDKIGQWYGDCSGSDCNLRVTIQEGAFFNAVGKHSFTVEQYMRKDPLKEIKSLAFRIEETEQTK